MPEPVEDFWPNDLVASIVPGPLSVLKEQAALLKKKTNSRIEGIVQTELADGALDHSLLLSVPALGNYMYRILNVQIPAEGYPAKLRDLFEGRDIEARDISEFKGKLKEILSSDKVKNVIVNLLSNANDNIAKS